jgi:hypothetical protein
VRCDTFAQHLFPVDAFMEATRDLGENLEQRPGEGRHSVAQPFLCDRVHSGEQRGDDVGRVFAAEDVAIEHSPNANASCEHRVVVGTGIRLRCREVCNEVPAGEGPQPHHRFGRRGDGLAPSGSNCERLQYLDVDLIEPRRPGSDRAGHQLPEELLARLRQQRDGITSAQKTEQS